MRFLRHEVTPRDIVSEVLDELVYHEDKTSHPISKLITIWDEGFLQERIFKELRFGRSLEEAARYWFQSKVQESQWVFFAGTLASQGMPNANVGVWWDTLSLPSLSSRRRRGEQVLILAIIN